MRATEFITEGSDESLSSMVRQDQAERTEYQNFVKSQAGGDWTKGASMFAQLKKRPSEDIFGDAARLNQFMQMKFDFDKFTDSDWNNYWLLAQHCDTDRNFQKKALAIIKKYQGEGHTHYKYLYDRISVGLTGKQKYGTQNIEGKQELSELFDPGTALPLEWERMPDLRTRLGKEVKGASYATAHDKDGRTIDISFVPMRNGIVDINFARAGHMDITGKGGAAQIFATVIHAINQYINAEKPEYISFSASEPSRAKLYQHMVKRLAGGYELLPPNQYPDSEELSDAQLGAGAFFLLRRRA